MSGMISLQSYISGMDSFTPERICAFAAANDVPIEEMDLSPRAKNVLRFNKIRSMSSLLSLNEAEFSALNMINESAAHEIRMMAADYLEGNTGAILLFKEAESASEAEHETAPEPKISSDESAQAAALLADEENRRTIVEALRASNRNALLSEAFLSTRAYNSMRRNRVDDIAGLIELYPDGFRKIRNVGNKTIEELIRAAETYVGKHLDLIRASLNGEDLSSFTVQKAEDGAGDGEGPQPATLFSGLTTEDILHVPEYRKELIKHIAANDIPIERLDLSVRSTNALRNSGVKTLSETTALYPDGFSELRNVGAKSVAELKSTVEFWAERVKAEHSTDSGAPDKDNSRIVPREYPEDVLKSRVLRCFRGLKFAGLHYPEIREGCPENVDEGQLKKLIGKMIRENELEYVDFRCYRKYPSILDAIDNSAKLSDREKDVLERRLKGETLETIAVGYSLTRERIRQIEDKARKKIRAMSGRSPGRNPYDEEYYRHFRETYLIPDEFWKEYSGVPERVWQIVKFLYKPGGLPLEEAISDPELDVPLKIRISDYLNRNRICLDGKMIERNRTDLENYVVRTYCREDTEYEDFVETYNGVLSSNRIEFDPKIYITEDAKKVRLNRLSESRICLWKHGMKLRYYDIDSGDYEELYDTLGLEEYENTEVSTLKFMDEYPELMRKYDIRDQYELHNLIRKTADRYCRHDMDLRRQPMLEFGVFDRNAAILEIITVLSPVTQEELVAYLRSEFGYAENTILMTILPPFVKYLTKGVYDVTSLSMPADRKAALKEALTEDLYPIKRLIAMYKRMFPEAPDGELHAGELRDMGFKIYSEFALRNWDSLDEYYVHLLTEHDTCTIKDKLRRYSATSSFYAVYKRLKHQYDIFLYEPDGLITFRRLEKVGVTREEIGAFADSVSDAVDEDEYFTMHSLRQTGFTSSLDRLGLDDFFLSEILAEDPRFARQRVFGTTVLCKTESGGTFAIRDFLFELLSEYDAVDIDDFTDLLRNSYGISHPDESKITSLIRESEEGFHYDSIMRTVYRDKSRFLSEFDD